MQVSMYVTMAAFAWAGAGVLLKALDFFPYSWWWITAPASVCAFLWGVFIGLFALLGRVQ